ncbi:MAG: amidohydrolase [Mobilicoccus sp.]|nr:amidohydrolase [Mobilicoccus sp.]
MTGAAQLLRQARPLQGDHLGDPVDLLVVHGRIAAVLPVGTRPDIGEVEVTDLGGRYVLPGFIESHGHPSRYAESFVDLDLRASTAPSIANITAAVADRARETPKGGWVRGSAWEESRLTDGRMPTRDDLDEVAPDVPVALTRTCCHMLLANSAALATAGIDESTPDPQGGHIVRDGAGRPTGLLQEKAMDLLQVPPPQEEDWRSAFVQAQRHFAAWGVTTVHDMSAGPDQLRRYARLARDGDLTLRLRPWLWAVTQMGMPGMLDEALAAGLTTGLGGDDVAIQGIKFVLDGAGSGRTAALSCPYHDTDGTGILYLDDDHLTEMLGRALDGGFRLAIHAIGDAAIDQAIRSLRATCRDELIRGSRSRIEHATYPTPDHLDAMVEYGLVAASSVAFLHELGDSYLAAFGPERIAQIFPHRTFIDRGIVAPGNSDVPVTTGNPWLGISAAVNRTTSRGTVLDTEQNITLAEALRAWTRDAAYASFEEDRLGLIASGAHADLAVYETDPFTVEHGALTELAPVATYHAGRLVHGGVT